MKRLSDRKRVFGILLAGCLLAGCFVPIIYGGYKLYESATMIGLSMDVKMPAPDLYAKAIATIEKRGITQITKRDDKKMVLELDKKGQKGSLAVKEVTPETSQLNIMAEKLKDIDKKVQEKELVGTVEAVCQEAGIVCKPAEKK
ncbi:MAG: hypothetical protein ACXWWT_10165 [Candidatus Deferrimicrobiaceae bacterium]